MPFSKWLHFLSVGRYVSKKRALPAEWHEQHGPHTLEFKGGTRGRMRFLSQIDVMDEVCPTQQLYAGRVRPGLIRLAQQLRVCLRQATGRNRPEMFTVEHHQRTLGRATEVVRLLENRVEHRRQIAGRGVDHLQHLGGCGLLIQRLTLLGQQPGILDRDHRLVGEGGNKFDLTVGERLNRCRESWMSSDGFAAPQQRHAERGSLLA